MLADSWLDIDLALIGMRIVTAITILVVGYITGRIVGGVLERAMLRSPLRSRRLMVEFLVRSSRVVFIVIATVMALAEVGVDVMPLVAGLGVGGLVIGFAFKDSLSNLAAGMLLLFYQPFELGDLVEAGGQTGSVLSMSIVATELRLSDGRLAIVPNSRIWGTAIINFNRLGSRRVEWTVSIAREADVAEGMALLREAVAEEPRILSDPAPQFLTSAASKTTTDLQARAWVPPADLADVTSDVRLAIKRKLDARGIN